MGDSLTSGVYRREGQGPARYDWRLVSNGHIIATSGGQGYSKRSAAQLMYDRVVGGFYAQQARPPE